MSSMEIILGDHDRLERLAVDIHDHYTNACEQDPTRVQKALIVCANRTIAYSLLGIFKEKYPEWFVEKKTPGDIDVSSEELNELNNMPFMAMIATVGKNDPKDMYDYLGGTKTMSAQTSLMLHSSRTSPILGLPLSSICGSRALTLNP